MKRIDLIQQPHDAKIGQDCPYLAPNITEDCIFYENGEAIGFYIKSMPERATKLANLANMEFQSKNVPKSLLNRSSAISQQSAREDIKAKYADKKGSEVSQMSVILGSIPPKPIVRRNYPSISSVHQVKSAQTFIKAMLMLAKESESIMHDILPEQYHRQVELFKEVPDKWKFANLFTSSISNYNISAPFHRDTGNIVGAVNVIITKRLNAKGGNLYVPDYGAVMDSADNSMLVYPAWKNVHGVTPIIPTHDGGYRNSLVFYPLKAFVGLK
jgi:hypothetical protein